MKTTKNDKYRDLLCYAAQYLIDGNLLGVNKEESCIIGEICGKRSVIQWRSVKNEADITIWWGCRDPFPFDAPFDVFTERRCDYYKYFDVSVGGWLGRKGGLWIMGESINQLMPRRLYCAKQSCMDLITIPTYKGVISKSGELIPY